MSISQGFNGEGRHATPIWYADRPYFRDERWCDAVRRSIRHTGWFGDTENQENPHRGIVGRLTHGRFIAGYHVDNNDERVYFNEVFDDEDEAASMADEHARIAAEREDEYSQQWNEAQKLRGLCEAKRSDVEKSFALRNHPKLGAKEREWTRDVIRDIRAFERDIERLEA